MVRVPYPFIRDLPERAREELWRNFESIDLTEGQKPQVRRYHYELWVQDTVAASQAAVPLALYGITTAAGDRVAVPILRAGYITGIIVRITNARSAGTLDVEATVNGVGSGVKARLDGTNPLVASTTETEATRATAQIFTGDELGVNITTSAGWAPTTEDISVVVEVTEFAFGDWDSGLLINGSFTSNADDWTGYPLISAPTPTRFTAGSYDGASLQANSTAPNGPWTWGHLIAATDGVSTYRMTGYARFPTVAGQMRIHERHSNCTNTGSNFTEAGSHAAGAWVFFTIDAGGFTTHDCSGVLEVGFDDALGGNATFDIDRLRFVKL